LKNSKTDEEAETIMLEGLQYFKENICQKQKPKETIENQKLVTDFMLNLTKDNDTLKRGI